MNRRWVYLGVVVAAGVCVLTLAVHSLAQRPLDHRWMFLAALVWLSAPLALRVPDAQLTLTVSESLTLVIAIGFGWQPAVLTVAVDGLLTSVRQRSRRVDRTLFNIAEPALSMAACALMLDWTSGLTPSERLSASLPALMVPGFAATTFYLLLNSAMTAGAVALETRTSVIAAWKSNLHLLVLDYLGGTSLALLVVVSAEDFGFWDLLTVLPLLGALYATYRTTIRRAGEAIRYAERLNRLYLATVESLAMAIDAKDQVTHGHITRVKSLTMRVAHALNLRDEGLLNALEAGALLHDVGKLGVPDHILNKPGPLTADEYDQVKQHTVVGAEIVGAVDFPYPVAPIVRHHHESWDGSGYPDGLHGADIPIGARILAVIDCYDAVTSDRPYRRALSHEQAMGIVVARRGTMYDPAVVDAFAAVLNPGAQDGLPSAASAAAKPRSAEMSSDPAGFGVRLASETRLSDADRARLIQFIAILAQHLDAGAVVSVMAPQLMRVTPATLVALFLPGASGKSLELACAFGAGAESLASLRPPVGRGLSGWVAAHRLPLLNANAALEFLDGAVPSAMPPRALSVPIVLDAQVLGVLTLYAQHRAFTVGDQALVDDLASAMAAAPPRAASTSPSASQRVLAGYALPDTQTFEEVLAAEARAQAPLFDSPAVLVVERSAVVEGGATVAEAIWDAVQPGDVVFTLGAGRAVVLMPGHARGNDPGPRECLARGIARVACGDVGLRFGFAGAPDDGESVSALVSAAEQRLGGTDRRDETSPDASATTGVERLAS